MSDAVLQATIKAYDEFTQQFQKFQSELKKTDQTQKQTAQGTDQLNRATSSFFQTIGNLGALYAFQRGLRETMQTGREFQLAIKQAQAVTNDMSSALRDAAMASKGIQGPTEIAKSFYELGSAGLNAQETIKATPDILDFATAGMLKMEDAAYAVSSTVKAFRLEWSQTTEVVDAFTQAMNSTAMKAEDFKWAMSTAGAVGKMAGQDFREVVGAIAAMRDAGVRAEDAGTSVKAALLQLINPTKEAKDVMKSLGIEVYDSSGKMKQWHDIIAELERALGPYNEQSRNLILTTIAGSDGVRAFATGLNMGSTKLAAYVGQMGSAEGATKKMAGVMSDSFDGALRRANASLEKTKILLFEDFSKGATGLLGVISGLVTGFNSLDEGGRRAIEMIVGGAGLVIALTILANVAKAAGLAIQAMWVKLGPVGWAILGISALATGVMGYKQAQQQATAAQQKANEKLAEYNKLISEGVPKERIAAVKEETAKIQELVKEYDKLIAVKKEESSKTTMGTGGNLTGTTEAYKAAESGIRKVNKELATYGLNAETARSKVEQLNQRVAEANALDYESAVGQANKSVKTKQATDATAALIQEYLTLTENVKTSTDVTNLSAAQQSRLSVVVGELSQKYPSLVTALDEHGQAMLMDNQGMSEQMSVMKALALIETQEARARIEAERAKTVEVINQTKARLQAILTEQKALRDANKFGTGTWSESPAGEDILQKNPAFSYLAAPRQRFESGVTTALSEEMKKRQATFEQAEKALKVYDDALKNLGSGTITNLPGEGGTGTGTFTAPESGSKGKNKALEQTKADIEAVNEFLYKYKAATEAAAASIGILSAKEQYLSQVMESGQGTAYQAIELNKVRAEQLLSLSAQQDKLHQQAEVERAALATLQTQYEAATDADSAKELRQEMENLTSSTYQLQQAWWQAEQQKLNLTEQVRQVEKKRYDDAYSKAMDLMTHQVNMARMSTEQQIKYLTKLKDAYQWSQAQLYSIDEDLYRLRKQQLSEYMSKLEDEYKDKLDAIDTRIDKTTKAIQAQIDALEGEGTASDREEAARKHNEKLKKLQEDRLYQELRTGIEHDKAIKDIDEQIAEENIEFQRQQEEWAREDKKDALQQQLDDAKEAGDEERQDLEEHYQKARDIAENGIMDIIASLAATSPKWMQTGKDLVDALIEGLESGDFSSVEDRIDRISRQSSKSTKTTPDIPSNDDEEDPDNMTWQQRLVYFKNHVSAALAEIARAGKVYTQKLTAGDIEGAGAAHHWANQIREAIGQSKIYDGNTASSSYKGYAKGGPIWETGPIYAHEGEYMIPANLVDAIRRGTVPPAQAGPATGGGGGTVIVNINAPLLAPENMYLSDNMDIRQVGDGLRKEIMALATAKG